MNTVVATPDIYSLRVSGREGRFPVNRIFCVGRNYVAHAVEMGANPDRDPPFFFMKPSSAIVSCEDKTTITYPPKTDNFHHEIELVVAIGEGGKNISIGNALGHVYGYAVGLDMTRRDLQLTAREKGRPWEFGKSFSESAPIGVIHPAEDIGHLSSGKISLTVNGEVRQSSDINLLIWSVAESIAFLSEYETLQAGDLIMTGTPEGVSAVVPGDVMLGHIDGLSDIEVTVA